MDKEIPAGTPRFGDPVGVRIQGAEAFGPRVREGIFLCIEEAMQDASQVLVDTEAGVRFMTTRLPTPLVGENKRWRKVVSPDETLAVWVSQDGSTRWTPPNADEVITVEERIQGPEAEDHELRVAARIRSVSKAEEGSEMNAFSCPADTITPVPAIAASSVAILAQVRLRGGASFSWVSAVPCCMDRVLLTLGDTQLQAVLDRNRGLFVLFQAEVRSAGGSWQAYDPSPPGSPSPGRTSGDNDLNPATPAVSSSASSDHGDWRPRLRSPSLEPRSRSPHRPVQRLPPTPPAARPRSQRRVPEPAGNAHHPQPPCPASTKARLASGTLLGRSRLQSPTSEVTPASRSGSETGPSRPSARASPCWDLLSATTLSLPITSGASARSMTACCSASLTWMTCIPRGCCSSLAQPPS